MSEVWIFTKFLVKQQSEYFTAILKRRFTEELGRDLKLELYVDDETLLVVIDDEEVYVNTDDDPLLFIGEKHAVDIGCLIERGTFDFDKPNAVVKPPLPRKKEDPSDGPPKPLPHKGPSFLRVLI
jgi:hypothetical protein